MTGLTVAGLDVGSRFGSLVVVYVDVLRWFIGVLCDFGGFAVNSVDLV